MPELPEVETVVRQLQKKLVGKTITKLTIKDRKVIDQKIESHLPFTISAIKRCGKSIIFSSKKGVLLIQLRMTGHFHYPSTKNDTAHQKYLSGIFYLKDDSFFTFNEIRRFGSVRYYTTKDAEKYLLRLGPDPLEMSSSLFCSSLLAYPSSAIKNKLLDQKTISGIGNIYAQEALFLAGINPSTQIVSLSKKKLTSLHTKLQLILRKAIEHNGTSVTNYHHLDGKGNFQNMLSVYKKTLCPKEHEIERKVIGGRGTYYCSVCQNAAKTA